MKQRTSLSIKLAAAYSILILLVAIVLVVSLYIQSRTLQRQAAQERLKDIISFAIPQVDGDFHARVRSRLDEEGEFYRFVYDSLLRIRKTSQAIHNIYTLRQRDDGSIVYVLYAGTERIVHVNDPYPDLKPGMQAGLSTIQAPTVEPALYRDTQGTFWVAYAPIYDRFGQQDGILVIETDAGPLIEGEARTRMVAFVIFIVTLPLILLLGWALTRRLTAPLNDLVDGTQRIAIGDLGYQVPVRSHDEIGVLSDTFNRMSSQLLQTLRGMEQKVEELERTERAFRRSEERFRRLAENALDVIFRYQIRPRSQHEYISSAAERISGYTVEEHYANPQLILQCIHPDDRRNFVRKFIRHYKQGVPLELRIINRLGEIRWIEVRSTVVPIEEPKVTVIEGIARDITERKHAEEEINRLNYSLEQRVQERTSQLEEANQELEAFTYSVSHDLRAPLRALDNLAAAMQEDYNASLDEQGHQYLRFIRQSSQRMSDMVDDLLRLSRISRIDIFYSAVDLSNMARVISQTLQASSPQRQVNWIIQPNVSVQADMNMMQIAMNNMLGNAWKFTTRRSPAEIEFGAQSGAGATVFFIRDNGVGFDMSYSHRLFSPFQRLHTENEFQGTGLGLATVQRIIRRHNGRIWAESSLDEGTTIYFTLDEGKPDPSID